MLIKSKLKLIITSLHLLYDCESDLYVAFHYVILSKYIFLCLSNCSDYKKNKVQNVAFHKDPKLTILRLYTRISNQCLFIWFIK